MNPESYLTDAERAELRAGGMSENGLYGAESVAALKDRRGAKFIRDRGFPTKNADAAYGAGWLD